MLCVFIPFPWSLIYLNLMFVVVLVKQETLSLRNFAWFFCPNVRIAVFVSLTLVSHFIVCISRISARRS